MSTIFALSSGAPPAGIAVIRVSGPDAGRALTDLAGQLPDPRRMTLATLRRQGGDVLDRAMVGWFPGPGTATGEDLAELHLHGGRAVVAAVQAALAAIPGLRLAEPGEFTRRAFANGRIDLAQAEGLADLLEAETDVQRAAALAAAGGYLSRKVAEWQDALLSLSAQVEAALDFADEDDVGLRPDFAPKLAALAADIGATLALPSSERLKEGIRVALAGPPNSGKSTLFNALVQADAAIATPIAGTTRDVLERSVAIAGIPFTFIDMAGLRAAAGDAVEALGIARAHAAIDNADVVLWLGDGGAGPARAWEIESQIDRSEHVRKSNPRHRISAVTGQGIARLVADLVADAQDMMPKPGEAALSRRQRRLLSEAYDALANTAADVLLVAENLRAARSAFDQLTGRANTEAVLDALFSRFCLGK